MSRRPWTARRCWRRTGATRQRGSCCWAARWQLELGSVQSGQPDKAIPAKRSGVAAPPRAERKLLQGGNSASWFMFVLSREAVEGLRRCWRRVDASRHRGRRGRRGLQLHHLLLQRCTLGRQLCNRLRPRI